MMKKIQLVESIENGCTCYTLTSRTSRLLCVYIMYVMCVMCAWKTEWVSYYFIIDKINALMNIMKKSNLN